MEQYIIYIFQSTILLILTPLFMGLIKNIKAYIRGYSGVPLLQVYYDLLKLFSKRRVLSKHSSFVTEVGPILCLTFAIAAIFMIPVVYVGGAGADYLGNIFIIIFLLAIIKFSNALIGLDSASAFGGMGSSREMFISMLSEPIMFILITFLYLETSNFNVFGIAYANSRIITYDVGHIIAATGFFILILAENARMPVDNPETHLELTMVHEAMILDMSGRDLAFLELASYIKLMVFLTLFINCFIPMGLATELSLLLIIKSTLLYFIKLILCLFVISIIETTSAKFRLFRLPEVLAAAFSISIVAIAIRYFI